MIPPARLRTPPSEDVEADIARDDVRSEGGKVKGMKGKVNFKDRDDSGKEKEKAKMSDAALVNETALGQALSREIRKLEESLHTRIGRLIGKEMDKQRESFVRFSPTLSPNRRLQINALRTLVRMNRRKTSLARRRSSSSFRLN
jgi:hypothetical protein